MNYFGEIKNFLTVIVKRLLQIIYLNSKFLNMKVYTKIKCQRLFKIRLKNFISVLLISFCSLTIAYYSIYMTLDYLDFKYNYKLIIDDNKLGFDLPPINVCTENNVLFDKNKVNKYFGSDYYYWKNSESIESIFKLVYNECMENAKYEYRCYEFVAKRNYNLSLFFFEYEKIIYNEFSFGEMISLIVNAKQLFECSAKFDFDNETTTESKSIEFNDFFESFRVSESVYANNDFGICYTFFEENNRIIIKESDYLLLKINYSSQLSFMANGVFSSGHYGWFYENYHMHSEEYFRMFLYISDGNRRQLLNRESAIESDRVGLEAELKIKKTTIELLSTPYMQNCVQNGEWFLETTFK